jgi:hypothetical protein
MHFRALPKIAAINIPTQLLSTQIAVKLYLIPLRLRIVLSMPLLVGNVASRVNNYQRVAETAGYDKQLVAMLFFIKATPMTYV